MTWNELAIEAFTDAQTHFCDDNDYQIPQNAAIINRISEAYPLYFANCKAANVDSLQIKIRTFL